MRIQLNNLSHNLTTDDLNKVNGGHIYVAGLLGFPVFPCVTRPIHLGFTNARRLFKLPFTNRSVCARVSPRRFGFHNV